MGDSFDHIILSRPDRIGDVIVSTACLEPLQERFPSARISMVVEESVKPLLDGHPFLEVFGLLMSSKERSLTVLDALFSEEDRVLLIELNSHPWVSEAAGKRPQLEHRRYKQNAFDFGSDIKDRRSLGVIHEARASWDLLGGLSVGQPGILRASLPNYASSWASFAHRYPLLRNSGFMVFHLGAHGGKRSWPIDCFVEVASILARSNGWLPVIVGVDQALSRVFSSLYSDPVLDLTGKTSLRELGALLGYAQLMLSRDSGPAHLAAAVGCPTVALMSSHPKHCAKRWTPLGENVAVVEQALPRKKIFESQENWWSRVFSMIGVEDVLTAVDSVARG